MVPFDRDGFKGRIRTGARHVNQESKKNLGIIRLSAGIDASSRTSPPCRGSAAGRHFCREAEAASSHGCVEGRKPARYLNDLVRGAVARPQAGIWRSRHEVRASFPLPRCSGKHARGSIASPRHTGGEAGAQLCGCGSSPPGSGPGFGRPTPVVGTGEPRSGGS